MSVLGNDKLSVLYLRLLCSILLLGVIRRSVNEDNAVGILLDGTGISYVGKTRDMISVFPVLGTSVKLRQCNNRNFKLLR